MQKIHLVGPFLPVNLIDNILVPDYLEKIHNFPLFKKFEENSPALKNNKSLPPDEDYFSLMLHFYPDNHFNLGQEYFRPIYNAKKEFQGILFTDYFKNDDQKIPLSILENNMYWDFYAKRTFRTVYPLTHVYRLSHSNKKLNLFNSTSDLFYAESKTSGLESDDPKVFELVYNKYHLFNEIPFVVFFSLSLMNALKPNVDKFEVIKNFQPHIVQGFTYKY